VDTKTTIALAFIPAVIGLVACVKFLAWRKGSLKIQCADRTYGPGEAIEGRILLTTRQPLEAQSLTITLQCRVKNGKNTHRVYTDRKQLFGPRPQGADSTVETGFSITVPQTIDDISSAIDLTIGDVDVRKLARAFTQHNWWLSADLEVKGVNVAAVQRVSIRL